MMTVDVAVEVVEENCIGCKACDNVCPTKAIVTVDRLARVEVEACIGCMRCVVACLPFDAISPLPLESPTQFGIPEEAYSKGETREEVEALCEKAQLRPEDSICFCTRGTAAEAAAAIVLKGATTIEEVSLETGMRGPCGIWCTIPIDRLLAASGVEREMPCDKKDWRTYPGAGRVGVWSVPEEVAKRWPEYRVEDEQEQMNEAGVAVPLFATITPPKAGKPTGK